MGKTEVGVVVVWTLCFLQSICALAVIGCGLASIALRSRLYVVGHCIWSGCFLLFATSLASLTLVLKWRILFVAHAIASTLTCLVTIPCLLYLLVVEFTHDYFYTYWTDDVICHGGCYNENGKNVLSYTGFRWLIPVSSDYLKCNNSLWTQSCHRNTAAVWCSIVAAGITCFYAMFVFVSCFTSLCIVCQPDGSHVKTGQYANPLPSEGVDQPDGIRYHTGPYRNLPYYSTVRPTLAPFKSAPTATVSEAKARTNVK